MKTRRPLLPTFGLVLGLATVGSAAAAPIEAVFFDLGDTLVASSGGTFVLRPGAAETVDALQARGIPLGIITNVPANWTIEDLEAALEEPEFLDEFDVVVLSSQAPAAKPNPAIYTFAHGQLPGSIPTANTAFVGENLSEIANAQLNPTLGCRAAGMLGIHLSDAAPSPFTDYTVPTTDLMQVVLVVENSAALFLDGFEDGDTAGWSSSVP
jgi:hypothetical protein